MTVEACTVAHREGRPQRAHVLSSDDGGARAWGRVEAPELLDAMMRDEFCGRRGRIDADGLFTPA